VNGWSPRMDRDIPGQEGEGKGRIRFQSACSCSVALAASQFKPFRAIFSCHLPVNFLPSFFFLLSLSPSLSLFSRARDGGRAGGWGLNYSWRATADKSANPQTWLLGRKMPRALAVA